MSHNSDYTRLYIGDGYGISIGEVASCLRSSSNDLGTLCRSDKINMLSYYKPTAYMGFDSGTRAQVFYYDPDRTGASPDKDACSIQKMTKNVSYSTYNSTSDVGTIKQVSDQYLFENQHAWSYIKPNYPGGIYRLRDFNGYIRRGAFTYAETATGIPYDTSLGVFASSGTLNVRIMLRFAMTGDYGGETLLGLQQLLAEGETTPLNLDFRYGFIIRAKNNDERTNPLCMMYISPDNLRDYGRVGDYEGDGVYGTVATKSGAVVSTWSDTAFRSNETIQAYPFIAKKAQNNWILYGFGIDSYPTVEEGLSTNAGDFGLNQGSITLTLDKQSDGTFVFYIAQSSHFSLQIFSTDATSILFGTAPVAIGVSKSGSTGHIITRKQGLITLGTKDSNSGYWTFPKSSATSGYIYGTNINGWNTTDDPYDRAGSLAVQPVDGLTSFKVIVHVNTNYGPRSGSATINVSSAQTGDTFPITLSEDSLLPYTPE